MRNMFHLFLRCGLMDSPLGRLQGRAATTNSVPEMLPPHVRPEHVSIFMPVGAEAASARVAERSSQDRQHNWPIPPPRAQFEAFGGKSTGWCAYDEAAQEILREAYTRKATAVVQREDKHRRYSYAVNTDPAVLTQVRSDLRDDQHSNVRKVRIVDLWGQLETVYGE